MKESKRIDNKEDVYHKEGDEWRFDAEKENCNSPSRRASTNGRQRMF
jgi:hypothetical protein